LPLQQPLPHTPDLPPLVENMVKKNRSCFFIAVLLTTLIRSH
jgi:hypothetical protein